MSRKASKYVVSSLSTMPLTLTEISEKCGIKKRVLYDRIHKLGWDIEKAVETPIKQKNTLNTKSNAEKCSVFTTTDNYTTDRTTFITMVESMFNKNEIAFSKPDYIGYKNNKPCIIKGINCDNNFAVSPWTSHPHRYPIGFYTFIPLIAYAKSLGGVLYLVNYAERGDENRTNEIRIIEVLDYYPEKIAEYIQTEDKYVEYLKIGQDLKLTKDEFKDWLEVFNLENKQLKRSTYKKYTKKHIQNTSKQSRPVYWKDPKPQVDHLGNNYKSIYEMCKAYNINTGTFRSRLKRGWSLENALTTAAKK